MKDLIDKRLIKLIKACDEAESKEDLLDIEDEIDAWIERRDKLVKQSKIEEEVKLANLNAISEMTRSLNPMSFMSSSFSDIMRHSTAVACMQFEKSGNIPSKLLMPFIIPKK